MTTSPFLAYDIRGKVGTQLTEEMAYQIGLAYCKMVKPKSVVIGRDIRSSSETLAEHLSNGLCDGGANVLDIGLCGTEVVYFATPHLEADGGIMITASHNPKGYNGMKLVKKDSIPISMDNGLHTIRDMVEKGSIEKGKSSGRMIETDIWEPYTEKVISFLTNPGPLREMRVVTDPGHGCAGPALDRIAEKLDLDLVRMHHEPDGNFPAGVPNPILPEMRGPVSKKVKDNDADVGVAWDGDFDRCFLFDENGSFTEGYYMVGLLARTMLAKESGGKVIHDPRLVWNTEEIVKDMGGIPIMNKTGHAFIKDRMRREDAVYGGEMSAHHYFRDFHYCDTGMIPWLLVLELMAKEKKPLSELIGERMKRFPISGEINRKVADQGSIIDTIERKYSPGAVSIDHTDGVSIEHKEYRLNLRSSNTEPLIRLNVEARGDRELLDRVTDDILEMIDREDA
ncbi:MAG: phosphomannomutase [Candidatus Thermoplasmatota archaeon]|nr:phosphomannomutase [Candidatus Thermoplasmatota archaeon]